MRGNGVEKDNRGVIEIVPDTSLWMKLGRTKYTIPKALSELIDNSVDNKYDEDVTVKIFFKVNGDYIGILDDGTGMSLDKLKNALTIALHEDKQEKIGEYGLGLKAATSFLGKKLTIYTRTSEMKEYIKFYYDENEFIKQNMWNVKFDYITKEQLLNETNMDFDRGTYILVEDLNVKLYKRLIIQNDRSGVLIPKFRRIYRNLLKDETLRLVLCVTKENDEEFEEIEIVPYEFIECNINVDEKIFEDYYKIIINGEGEAENKTTYESCNESNNDYIHENMREFKSIHKEDHNQDSGYGDEKASSSIELYDKMNIVINCTVKS